MKARDQKILDYLGWTAVAYAKIFRLPLKSFQLLPPKKTFYGLCYPDGRIKMSIRRKNGSALQPSLLIDILAHELAHLRHLEHNSWWLLLFTEILADMVKHGVLDRLQKLCNSRE